MTLVSALPVSDDCSLSIVMPCLNEAETLATCIAKAKEGLANLAVKGEIIVADNGSTDGSQEIAVANDATLVCVDAKGYGNALRHGIKAAKGRWIIMGDADDSYDFSKITAFVQKLTEGYELVMGCRLPAGGGTILPGAMPWKNRWIGNPALSFLGRLFFSSAIHDFHCGLRAFTKESYLKLNIQSSGMEFASEMVVKASLWGTRVSEVPIILSPDGRNRPPHLRPWRDGWRHLRFMFIYSPRWLFLLPGLIFSVVGALLTACLTVAPIRLGSITLDIGVMMLSAMALIVGVQLSGFAVCTKVFAIGEGLLPQDERLSKLFRFFKLETGLVLGAVLLVVGFAVLATAVLVWKNAGFGALPYEENMRRIIPGAVSIILAIQIISTSFFLSILGLKTAGRTPPQ